jgi:hypothetical protein
LVYPDEAVNTYLARSSRLQEVAPVCNTTLHEPRDRRREDIETAPGIFQR